MKALKLASTAVVLCMAALSLNVPQAQARGLGSRGSDYAASAAWGALYRMYKNSHQSDSYDYSGYSDSGISTSSGSQSRSEEPAPKRLTEAERIFAAADTAAAKIQADAKDDCTDCKATVRKQIMKIQTNVEELADQVDTAAKQGVVNDPNHKVVVHTVEVTLNLADTKYRVACKIDEETFAELFEINFDGLPVATYADQGTAQKIQTPDFMGADTIAKIKATPRSEDAKRFLEKFKSLVISQVEALPDHSQPGHVTAQLTQIAGPGGITGSQLKGLIETFIPANQFKGCLILEPKTQAVMYVYPYKP